MTVQVVTTDRTKLKVRLYGIDAPERPKVNHRTGRVDKLGQPYDEAAERALGLETLTLMDAVTKHLADKGFHHHLVEGVREIHKILCFDRRSVLLA